VGVTQPGPRLDFENEIRSNRRWTWVLLLASFLLLAVVASVGAWAFGGGWAGVAFGVVLALALTVFAYFSSSKLALGSTGAHPAPITEYLQLHNLVESMAISAGIPKPAVYIVNDPAPNAFATGRDPSNAAVAVTTGLLERMSRDELEGVLAHELAHIRNLDIRVMTVAVATAGSVAVITDVFWRIAFWGAIAGGGRRRNNGGNGGNPLALIAMVFVAVLAPIAALLLKSAISRTRESLADATAVKLTRYPTGLRRALEKLDADSTVVRRTSHATSHLWIESPDEREPGNRGARVNQMFSTHPPLSERIDILRSMEGLPPYQGPEQAVLDDLARREAEARATPRPAPTAPMSAYSSDRPAADSMPNLPGLFGGADAPDFVDDGDVSDLPPPPPPPTNGAR
jgi:heat shock protein HtpX